MARAVPRDEKCERCGLGAGVGGVVDFFHALSGDVGVDLGGAEAGVAEEGLDAAEVGAVVEEVGGEAMAKFVRGDVDGEAGVFPVFVDDVGECLGGDAAAEFAEEEGAFVDGGFEAVALDGFEGVAADRAEAFFAAFADDADGFGVGVEVVDVEAGEFAEAHAGGVEHFEDGGVAFGCPGGSLFVLGQGQGQGEHGLDLSDGEDDREFLFLFGDLDVEEGVVIPSAAMVQPFVEAAEGGEVEADGGAAFFLLHEVEEVATEVVG